MAFFDEKTAREGVPARLSHRLADLQHEVQRLGGAFGGYRHDLQQGAGEVGEVLLRQGARLARKLGRNAKRAGRAVRKDPVPALAMAIAAGCLLSLVLNRK